MFAQTHKVRRSFTLQWHLTNACRFRCRHCYDRTARGELSLEEARDVLERFLRFCRERALTPALSLTGGDPMACSWFWQLYGEIAEKGLTVTILGNPLCEEELARLMEIRAPAWYQVSLEGLREHNDAIRGDGHYDQALRFLVAARRHGLKTHVMLTLTRENLGQVLALAGELQGLVHRFTFNRLVPVGEGAALELPGRDSLREFLQGYLHEARGNPLLGCKDNLFNVLRDQAGEPLLGGCTGHGCGAASDFFALLPDGELHACRKFMSLLGNIRSEDFGRLHDCEAARRYRAGPEACRACRLRARCRGCMAVIQGTGGDPLRDRDPFCFVA